MVYRAPDDQDSDGMRVCTKCAQRKPMDDYFKTSGGHRRRVCKVCAMKMMAKNRADRPEQYALMNIRAHRRRKYGLTPAQIAEMLRRQNDLCGICPEAINEMTAHVDHDHTTLEVRGLLCQNCNIGLGHFKDDQGLLWLAIAYLSGPTVMEMAS